MIWLVGVGQPDVNIIKVNAESLDEGLDKARELDSRYCSAKPYESDFDDQYYQISDREI